MKKALSAVLTLAICLCTVFSGTVSAAPAYDYPTKGFSTQLIPEPKASYIPDDATVISMFEFSASGNFDSEAFVNSEYGQVTSLNMATSYSGYMRDMDEGLVEYWGKIML